MCHSLANHWDHRNTTLHLARAASLLLGEGWRQESGSCQPKPQWPFENKISPAQNQYCSRRLEPEESSASQESSLGVISLPLTGWVTLSRVPVLSKNLQSPDHFRIFSSADDFTSCFRISTPSHLFRESKCSTKHSKRRKMGQASAELYCCFVSFLAVTKQTSKSLTIIYLVYKFHGSINHSVGSD